MWRFRILAMIVVLYAAIHSSAAVSDMSKGMLSSPTTLKDVESFRWYVITHAIPQNRSVCEIDFNSIAARIVPLLNEVKSPNIEHHREGGASDVFLFRIYLDAVEVGEGVDRPAKCVLGASAELAYFDKVKFVRKERLPPPAPKFVLWSSGTVYSVTNPPRANVKSGVKDDELSTLAASYAVALFNNLLKDIKNVKAYGYEE